MAAICLDALGKPRHMHPGYRMTGCRVSMRNPKEKVDQKGINLKWLKLSRSPSITRHPTTRARSLSVAKIALPIAVVAQWQSTDLVNRGSRVQVPPAAFFLVPGGAPTQLAAPPLCILSPPVGGVFSTLPAPRGCSSTGRAAVSKAAGCRFDSDRPRLSGVAGVVQRQNAFLPRKRPRVQVPSPAFVCPVM